LSRGEEYSLTRVPKGYDADNPAADYLKLKSFVALSFFKETDLTSKDLTKKVLTTFETLQPLLEFVNRSIE